MHRARLPLCMIVCMIALVGAPVHAASPPLDAKPADAPPAGTPPAGEPPEVRLVEFYTSEACASCLPADATFARIAGAADVVALAFHVVYWNYLGSPDRFALPVADNRQWAYARRWRHGEVFTPQMIVNGTISGTGDSASAMAAMMRQAKPLPRIGLTLEKGRIVATVPALPEQPSGALWIVTFDRHRDVAVKGGETGGQVIHEVDIVRYAAPVARLERTPQRITVPLRDIEAHDGIASFVQARKGGPITAAGRMYLDQQSVSPP